MTKGVPQISNLKLSILVVFAGYELKKKEPTDEGIQ